MNGWQIAMLLLLGGDVGLAAAMHGRPREGYYSVWVTLTSSAILLGILIGGGFFR